MKFWLPKLVITAIALAAAAGLPSHARVFHERFSKDDNPSWTFFNTPNGGSRGAGFQAALTLSAAQGDDGTHVHAFRSRPRARPRPPSR